MVAILTKRGYVIMSKDLVCILIAKMYIRLNQLIEKHDFNLQNEDVQKYSRRLDRALLHYSNLVKKEEEKQMSNFFSN